MSIPSDMHNAARALKRSPLYTLTVVGTLALGVGALALALAFANAFFLRPMPFRDGHELVGVSMTHRVASGEMLDYAVSINDYLALRERNTTFTDIGVINQQNLVAMIGDTPETLRGGRVSATMWTVLGTAPLTGRVFAQEEDRADNAIVVISANLAQRLGDGNPAQAIGKPLVIDGVARTIVGVMPRGFRPRMNPGDAWLPLGASPSSPQIDTRMLQTVARLRQGVTLAQAEQDVDRVARELQTERPAVNRDWGASTKDLRAKIGDRARGVTLALVAAVVFMLVLACANAANLAIARVVRRRADIATRLALGASAGIIARQYACEAILLAAAGGVLGTLLAAGALPLALGLLTSDNPLLSLVGLDWRVMSIVALASIIADAVASGAPAILSARIVGGSALTQGARRLYAGIGDSHIRRGLMSVQVAASAVLLAGTVSAIASLTALLKTDVGYDPASLTIATVALPTTRYAGLPQRNVFVTEVQDRLRGAPGILSVGTTTGQFLRDSRVQSMFAIIGEETPGEPALAAEVRRVTAGYFETLRVPVLRGRAFGAADRDSSPPVVIVNESFVTKYLAGRDPLATRVRRGSLPPMDIIGVVPDSRDGGASEEPGPAAYLPFAQSSAATVTFVVSGDPAVATRALREAIRAVDPGLPLDRVAPLASMLSDSLGEERFRTVVLGVMTLLATLIACVGIYGATAYLVQQRAREVAIRLALGATRPRILTQLVGGTVTWIAGGALAGIAVSWMGGAQFARRFPELAPAAGPTYLAVAIGLILVGGMASAWPSIRASGSSPSGVLRGE